MAESGSREPESKAGDVPNSDVAGSSKTTEQRSMDRLERLKYLSNIDFRHVEDISKYEKVMKIGQGTFGEVSKARCRKTGELVALKKILMENEKEGFPITALREIKILQTVNYTNCENVVRLKEICRTKPSQHSRFRSTFYLVFELADHDLAGILSNAQIKLELKHKKQIMKQLFNALHFIHSNKIIHRDMKAANVLITRTGELKLADFGLARSFSRIGTKEHPNRFTNRVVTLWYRPPELLLGDRNYGPPIDMWGAACIMVELWTRNPILQGKTEIQQLELIMGLCGSITEENYPNCKNLNAYKSVNFPKDTPRETVNKLQYLHRIDDPLALKLLDNLFVLDPLKRFTADNACDDDWIWEEPFPGDLDILLKQYKNSNYEYTTQQERRAALAGQSQQASAIQQQQQYVVRNTAQQHRVMQAHRQHPYARPTNNNFVRGPNR